MSVISNSSPLISLAKVHQLDLLPALFGLITIPPAVFAEVVTQGRGRIGVDKLSTAPWLSVHPVQDQGRADYLGSSLDAGEAEALILAQELRANWLILDEIKARTIARRLHIAVIGTAGVLVLAKRQNLIPFVRPLLDDLMSYGFRLSDRVYQTTLQQAGE